MKKMILRALPATLPVSLLILSLVFSNPGRARLLASEGSSPSNNYQVKIDNFSFAPATLTVPTGATVTWVNRDDVPHNIVSSEGNTLKSPVMDTDGRFSHTFTKPGTYPYYCGVHPKMTGKVVVQ